MKSMKLYADVHRIYNDLAAAGIGPDDPLTVDQLTPFDQYHYYGAQAVDEALTVLKLKPGDRVLDVGSGIGGPARYIADRTGAEVTALELQGDLDIVARDLTRRAGLDGKVRHVNGDMLDGTIGSDFAAIISMLCMLHIADKARLFACCRAALRPGGVMYIEDFARPRTLTAAEWETLSVKVQCAPLPTVGEYRQALDSAGFRDVTMTDVSDSWRAIARSRYATFCEMRARNEAIHGAETIAGLDDFYGSVVKLWDAGAMTGLKIVAR